MPSCILEMIGCGMSTCNITLIGILGARSAKGGNALSLQRGELRVGVFVIRHTRTYECKFQRSSWRVLHLVRVNAHLSILRMLYCASATIGRDSSGTDGRSPEPSSLPWKSSDDLWHRSAFACATFDPFTGPFSERCVRLHTLSSSVHSQAQSKVRQEENSQQDSARRLWHAEGPNRRSQGCEQHDLSPSPRFVFRVSILGRHDSVLFLVFAFLIRRRRKDGRSMFLHPTALVVLTFPCPCMLSTRVSSCVGSCAHPLVLPSPSLVCETLPGDVSTQRAQERHGSRHSRDPHIQMQVVDRIVGMGTMRMRWNDLSRTRWPRVRPRGRVPTVGGSAPVARVPKVGQAWFGSNRSMGCQTDGSEGGTAQGRKRRRNRSTLHGREPSGVSSGPTRPGSCGTDPEWMIK